jgi:tetrapyrrole methylase family protein/MazG family protein/ATP diphosphatase
MGPTPIARLIEVMARLRDPTDGCAWDLEQTFATIAPYTIEEAYEVADAIERGDMGELRDELGDLLLQVVFHARMAEEAGAFGFDDVAGAVTDKMIRRHPHVFGDAIIRSSAEQARAWEEAKATERAAKGAGWLDAVAMTLPALTRAVKLSSRAARVGFVWPTLAEVMAKLKEEVAELEAEVERGDKERIRDELGDVLFVCANIARTLDIDPEDALRNTNAKFVRRFGHIEKRLAQSGRTPADSTLAEMDGLWDEAKAAERAGAEPHSAAAASSAAGRMR